ncbi:asparagine synthase (glutamine-hydrolyzing) [Rheinheimera sp.]|uniref:asparagine synthase (glutamine-hydrolyzing) n=1 Tax=Rheinheimera sp. TaxID=1869214 RepID=UPI003D2A3636
MCGFAGFFSRQQWPHSSETILQQMTDAIAHRGPDDAGLWWQPASGVGLAHRRLAIVDLSAAGHQPMLSPSGRYVLVYNGEVYNHLRLRAALAEEGFHYQWRGHSDTETLLAGFESWGVKATLQRCIGMFALVLFDQELQQLYLARDRMGEKPLYFGWQQGTLLFASELKALEQHPAFLHQLDRAALVLYFRHNYIPAPHSVYQGIAKLAPATLWVLDLASGHSSSELYWDLATLHRQPKQAISAEQSVEALDLLMRDAISLQMVADVPLGAFLSGGVDSSTIVALMQAQSSRQVKTFSIGFDDPAYNEAQFAAQVAAHLGTDHTEWYMGGQDALAAVPKMSQVYDEPFADSSQLPTALVTALARQQVTVVLSGDAGDELFNGYERYQIATRLHQRLAPIPAGLRKLAGRSLAALPTALTAGAFSLLTPLLPASLQRPETVDKIYRMAELLQQPELQQQYVQLISHHATPEKLLANGQVMTSALLSREMWLPGSAGQSHLAYLDLCSYLPDDILVKVDRAAMAVSLEGRIPLLDHRVVEFAATLPDQYKTQQGQSKWCLRQVLYRYVPANLIERPKRGFAVPMASWLRGPLRDWAESLLAEAYLTEQGVLNPQVIRAMWSQHLSGQRNHASTLWNVLMLQAWLADRPGVKY